MNAAEKDSACALHAITEYAILWVANVVIKFGTRKAPKVLAWGAFLFPWCRQGLTPRLVAVASLVEPFTDIVGNYTGQDGENKRCDHIGPPFPCQVWGGNE